MSGIHSFTAGCAQLLLLLGVAAPAGASAPILAHLDTGGISMPRPTAVRRLLWETKLRTSIEAAQKVPTLRLQDPELFRYPLLYLAGSGAFPPQSEADIQRLRRYLTYGGTVLVDNADAEPGGAFDTAVRRLFSRALPDKRFERMPKTHVVYKSFYLVETQAGRVIRAPYLESLRLDERDAVIYSLNDLGGAWARDSFGRWEYQVSPGGERQREVAFRLGINILMYAMCLDYKEDLVHAPFIIKRRR